jgi:diacylglycerol O-acyltransferase-1
MTASVSRRKRVGPISPDKILTERNDATFPIEMKPRAHRVVHTTKRSALLSTFLKLEDDVGPSVDFRGVINLFFVLLIILNIRLVIENLLKYGSRLQLPRLNIFDSWWIFGSYLTMISLPAVSFFCEKHLAVRSRRLADSIQLLIIVGTVVAPYRIVQMEAIHPIRSLVLLFASMIYTMKIWSFWKFEKINLNLFKLYKFLLYPTLIYQEDYPTTDRVRIRHVLRYTAEFLFCTVLQFIIVEQYITPILQTTTNRLNEFGKIEIIFFLIERLLKLSIPTLYLWILLFLMFFHCYLNLLAELTRFGDRQFYLDWWNAVSFRDYWQKWNQPVHQWLLRHLYKPLRAIGIDQTVCGLIVFVFSGVIHEYLILTPLKISYNGIITVGFVSQLPLIVITDSNFIRNRPVLGNCLFWITNCFTGQPFAIIFHFLVASNPELLKLSVI